MDASNGQEVGFHGEFRDPSRTTEDRPDQDEGSAASTNVNTMSLRRGRRPRHGGPRSSISKESRDIASGMEQGDAVTTTTSRTSR